MPEDFAVMFTFGVIWIVIVALFIVALGRVEGE